MPDIQRADPQLTDRDELIAAYNLLAHAVPLAFRLLTAGGVDPFTQWCFWKAFETLDEMVDGGFLQVIEDEPKFADRAEALACEDDK